MLELILTGALAFLLLAALCAGGLAGLAELEKRRGAMATLAAIWDAPEAGETARPRGLISSRPQVWTCQQTEGTAAPARGVIDLEAYRRSRRPLRLLSGESTRVVWDTDGGWTA